MQAGSFTADLIPLVNTALRTGTSKSLEAYIRSKVSDGYEGIILGDFGLLIGKMCKEPNPPVAALEKLLDGWAERSPATNYIQISAALTAYMHVAVMRPDWWDDELRKIRKAARITQPMVVGIVIKAMLFLFTVEAKHTLAELEKWATDKNPNVQERLRNIVAALDEMMQDASGQNEV